MADHDEQISNNRRRLFKALSTAPVVMTLRPGSALANDSSYQCVQKIIDDTTFDLGPLGADNLVEGYYYGGPWRWWLKDENYVVEVVVAGATNYYSNLKPGQALDVTLAQQDSKLHFTLDTIRYNDFVRQSPDAFLAQLWAISPTTGDLDFVGYHLQVAEPNAYHPMTVTCEDSYTSGTTASLTD